ncbi:TetR/AcrR family transcriptional regulator [Peribacillus loiseleuriae]|uniref:TetR family transcriptional regulator n=1 Tax=Peribacillus loiseleuriae TaxID=1679170 RepID=A0A0K9GTB2_9BACI|nr:TetR/AcrR family transcriptional regulator [Peribacillus loiseleuriae]KMY49863.1 TetR family transcriptional regulator [Peribacillus loiseleuriae]
MVTELKEQIIETSLILFEKYGFHGVSVNQIVQVSGTSKGGFYHHFQSKDELLFVIHDYFISYVLTQAEEAIVSSIFPTVKLQKIIKSFVTVFDLYKAHISVFYQESTYLKPKYEEIIKQKRQNYRDLIFDVIQEGIELGEFRPELSVDIIGMSIIGMVNWSYKWYKKDGEKSIEEIADMYVDFILHSLLTGKTKQNPVFQPYFLHNRLSSST